MPGEASPDESVAATPARRVLAGIDWRTVAPIAVALFIGLAAVAVVPLLARPVALLVIGITLAEALAPVVSFLERRVSRNIAITIVFAGLFVLLGLCVWAVVPPLLSEARGLGGRLPGMIEQLRAVGARFGVGPERLDRMVESLTARIGDYAVGVPLGLASTIINIFLVIFLAVYWLAGAHGLMRFTLSLVPRERRDRVREVLQHIGRAMGGYVRGAFITAVIMGVLAFIGLVLIGVPYALVLGVLTMFGELIPIIGPVAVGVIVVLVALVQSFTKAVLAAIVFTALAQLEGHILTPNIMRRQTRVPQTLVLFAIVVGGAVGGLVGIIVSIPIAAAVRVLVVEVIAPAERRWSGITRED